MTTELKCESWCTEGDGHPRKMYRADQWCQGPMRMTVLGLESPNSPALPVKEITLGETPALTVYARRDWYGLPFVRMNIDRPHQNQHLSIDDVDISLTPFEAVELANHLISIVEDIGGAK